MSPTTKGNVTPAILYLFGGMFLSLPMEAKITITGDLGSGKSAVSRILKERLGFEIYSTGKVQREIAARYGMTTLELNQFAEKNPEIDDEIDSVFKKLNVREEGLIVDSRMAWHFMPASYKVFLMVPVEVAARRIMSDPNRKSEEYRTIEEAVTKLIARKSSENQRFLDVYQVDCTNPGNFDLAVNTSNLRPEQVAETIIAGFEIWKKG